MMKDSSNNIYWTCLNLFFFSQYKTVNLKMLLQDVIEHAICVNGSICRVFTVYCPLEAGSLSIQSVRNVETLCTNLPSRLWSSSALPDCHSESRFVFICPCGTEVYRVEVGATGNRKIDKLRKYLCIITASENISRVHPIADCDQQGKSVNGAESLLNRR